MFNIVIFNHVRSLICFCLLIVKSILEVCVWASIKLITRCGFYLYFYSDRFKSELAVG